MAIEFVFFFFKQKTAYEMRISDWSSDVCSSDLGRLSATSARAGSMLILFDAVSSQSAATDAHKVVALGMISSASAVSSPPAMRKGRRRPKRDRDPSLRWPTMGWTISPVIGPALHKEIGRASCRERGGTYV